MALFHQRVTNVSGHLGLGTTDQRTGDDALDGAIGGLSGSPQERHLLVVLDLSQRSQQLRCQAPLGARQPRLQAQHEGSPQAVRDEDAPAGRGSQ